MKNELYALHHDLEDSHWWFVARRKILFPIIRSVMQDHPDDLIVDIGCGTGGTVGALSAEYRCVGFDDSEQAILSARSKYPSCDFILGDALTDLEKVSPDVALCLMMDVLEHIEDDRNFLSKVISQARPGSHILITVPANPELWSQHDETAGHFRRYEHDTLSQLWSGLPVSVRFISYFNNRLYLPIWFARVIGKRLGLFSGRDGSDFDLPPKLVNVILAEIFAGEAPRIARLMQGYNSRPYSRGVSLVALLRCD